MEDFTVYSMMAVAKALSKSIPFLPLNSIDYHRRT